jgi:hypothetical protein
LKFERKRYQALNFLCRVIGPLGDDFDQRGREIRIRVYGHALKRNDPADRDEQGQHKHQEPLPKGCLDDSMDHSDAEDTILT